MLQPTHDYVVLEMNHTSESGILLSSNRNQAKVVAIGPEVQNPIYHVGSTVYFDMNQAIECAEYLIVQDVYILAEVRI